MIIKIEILEMQEEDSLGIRVDGKLEKDALLEVSNVLEVKLEEIGKVKFYMEIGDFGINDLTADAVKEDLKFWLNHQTFLLNFAKVTLVTDLNWVKKIFDIECALIPTLEG